MFFRLPVVRFFNRVINRATVTVALVLLQIGWLLWAFFSLTAGKVWVNAGLNVLSLFITLYLVRKDENSDYKIIWLVLIGMMPLLGGALYLAFGNKAPAKRMRQRMQAVERQHTADLAQQPGQTDALDPASRGLSRYVSEYGPYPAWKNSTAKYYPCGEAMYPDLLADLEKAERFIFLEFFIVRTGRMWKGVEDILVRKAAQGVDVRLIYDDFGSLLGLPSDFVVQMERAHIRCIPFNPVVPLVSLVMNHRGHRGGYGKIDVTRILEVSSNIGVSYLIDKHYSDNPQKFVDGLKRIGIDRPLHLQIAGEGKPNIRGPKERYFAKTTLPWMSIGYETQVPPLNILTFYNAIANNGTMVRPKFVKAAVKDGEVVHEFPTEVINPKICSGNTLTQIREILHKVVSEGLAKPAGSKQFAVAGKTGTAQNPRGKDHSTFLSFAPKDNPRIAISVYVENGGFGASAALPIASLLEEYYLTDTVTRPWLVEMVKQKTIYYPAYGK